MPDGSRPGRLPGRNRSRDLVSSSSRPNSTCAMCPSAVGRTRHAPGFAAKPFAMANWAACGGSAARTVSQLDLVVKVIGTADVAGEVANGEVMLARLQ